MVAYYNENNPDAAEWLRNLIRDGLIAPGDVDERSIVDVKADDVVGYDQRHWFAGIGGWSLALRLAGVPDDFRIDTGSCPCQPFSQSGRGEAQNDPRHLWPCWFSLICGLHPQFVVGEQVPKAIKYGWLDGVFSDLAKESYTCGSVVLGTHSVKSPHIRQRLWWGGFRRVSDSGFRGREMEILDGGFRQEAIGEREADVSRGNGASSGGVRDAECSGLQGHSGDVADRSEPRRLREEAERSVAASDPWSDYTVGEFSDGQTRRIGRGVQPLAYGVPRAMVSSQSELRSLARVAGKNRKTRLMAYGNAICPQVAAVFIRSFLESVTEMR